MTATLVSAARLLVAAMDGDYPMEDALPALRRAFEAHEQRDGFASACWSIDDVQSLRPEWTEVQTREWLLRREGLIQDAMVEAGWEAIATLLDEHERAPIP